MFTCGRPENAPNLCSRLPDSYYILLERLFNHFTLHDYLSDLCVHHFLNQRRVCETASRVSSNPYSASHVQALVRNDKEMIIIQSETKLMSFW